MPFKWAVTRTEAQGPGDGEQTVISIKDVAVSEMSRLAVERQQSHWAETLYRCDIEKIVEPGLILFFFLSRDKTQHK